MRGIGEPWRRILWLKGSMIIFGAIIRLGSGLKPDIRKAAYALTA